MVSITYVLGGNNSDCESFDEEGHKLYVHAALETDKANNFLESQIEATNEGSPYTHVYKQSNDGASPVNFKTHWSNTTI